MTVLRKLLVLALISQLAACASKSAYDSGWTDETNEQAYGACGQYRVNKQFSNPGVLEGLIASGALSRSQAQRAIKQDVRIGDSECLAYAAYGLDRAVITTQKNTKGQVTQRLVTYQCSRSEVSCPSVRVHFADGVVSSIETISK